jgi:hypothetical protein
MALVQDGDNVDIFRTSVKLGGCQKETAEVVGVALQSVDGGSRAIQTLIHGN